MYFEEFSEKDQAIIKGFNLIKKSKMIHLWKMIQTLKTFIIKFKNKQMYRNKNFKAHYLK